MELVEETVAVMISILQWHNYNQLWWITNISVLWQISKYRKCHSFNFYIGPLTRATGEASYSRLFDNNNRPIVTPVFIVTGILTGKACRSSTYCQSGTSAYVNLRDPDVHRFLEGEVSDFSGILIDLSEKWNENIFVKRNEFTFLIMR